MTNLLGLRGIWGFKILLSSFCVVCVLVCAWCWCLHGMCMYVNMCVMCVWMNGAVCMCVWCVFLCVMWCVCMCVCMACVVCLCVYSCVCVYKVYLYGIVVCNYVWCITYGLCICVVWVGVWCVVGVCVCGDGTKGPNHTYSTSELHPIPEIYSPTRAISKK